jgi:hypothetical protein
MHNDLHWRKTMQNLKSQEGQVISAIIRWFHPAEVRDYKLHLVETFGIWVENQAYTDKILSSAGVSSAPRTLVAFVPWSEVVLITTSIAVSSLSERAFGL